MFCSGSLTITNWFVSVSIPTINSSSITLITGLLGIAFFVVDFTKSNSSIVSVATPTGVVDFINKNAVENGRLTLTSPTGTFAANSQFKEQVSGHTGVINAVTELAADEVVVKFGLLDLEDTVTTVTGKLATSTTARDTTFKQLTRNGRTFLDERKLILGQAQEIRNKSPCYRIQAAVKKKCRAKHKKLVQHKLNHI